MFLGATAARATLAAPFMNLRDFTGPQREALLDLVLLAMYADGHLADAEDARVHRLLAAMGFDTDYDQDRQYDAAVGRISRHSQTAAAVRTHTATLAGNFASPAQRRQVQAVLDDLLASDGRVAPQESSHLAIVKEAFQS